MNPTITWLDNLNLKIKNTPSLIISKKPFDIKSLRYITFKFYKKKTCADFILVLTLDSRCSAHKIKNSSILFPALCRKLEFIHKRFKNEYYFV